MTIALVTGSNRGIGLEVVRQLAQQDITVILTAWSEEKVVAAIKQLDVDGLTVMGKTLDVDNVESINQLASDIESEFGHLDILINNAARFADWSEMASLANLDDAMSVIETNLMGTWRVIQTMLPLIRKSDRGRIVNVSSGAGLHSDVQFGLMANGGAPASYGISKAAVNALTVKFAAELADTNILVNAVGPGLTATAPGMEAWGARPIPEGAASVVWGATSPELTTSGGFYRDGKAMDW